MNRTALQSRLTAAVTLAAMAGYALGVTGAGDALARSAEDLLAPRVVTLDASTARTSELLDQARVFQNQLASAQALFVAERCDRGACEPKRAAQLIADSRYAGHAARDLLQSARAELDRTLDIAEAETVQPMLDDARREQVQTLKSRTAAATRAWLVRTAWYQERMAPLATKLKTELAEQCARDPGATIHEAQP